MVWDSDVYVRVEGECDGFFIPQKMPHYAQLHLKTKRQDFHFYLKYHNLSVYTKHSMEEKNWYSLIILEDGKNISSMMVSWGVTWFQIVTWVYFDQVINTLPKICLMIRFSDYQFPVISSNWFLLSFIIGEGWRKQNNQWDDSCKVWLSRRPKAPLFWILVSSDLWGFR